jgi:hypothetical protein
MILLGSLFVVFGAATFGLMGAAPVEEGYLALGGTAAVFSCIGLYTLGSELVARRQQRRLGGLAADSGPRRDDSWSRVLRDSARRSGPAGMTPSWDSMRHAWRRSGAIGDGLALHPGLRQHRLKLS